MSGSIATLFQRLTQGVYVVGVARGETRDAFTAAWVMQVSYDPLLLALSINANHSSYRLIKEGRSFTVNVLKKGQLNLADHYGQSARTDKMALTDWTNDRTGPPLLREGLAWFECEIVDEHAVGDHVLVVGRVIDGKLVDSEASPCAIAKPAQWMVPLLSIPTLSEGHDAPESKRISARWLRRIYARRLRAIETR